MIISMIISMIIIMTKVMIRIKCYLFESFKTKIPHKTKFTKSSKIRLSLERAIADLFEYSGALARFFISGRKTGYQIISAVNFGIFLKFPNFPRSSRGNLYIELVGTVIYSRFDCGEGQLWQKVKKVQDNFAKGCSFYNHELMK